MKFLPILFLCACSAQLTPKQQARLDKFECQAEALKPLVEPVYDAVELLQKLRTGEANLNAVLENLDAARSEVEALFSRLEACNGDEPAPVEQE